MSNLDRFAEYLEKQGPPGPPPRPGLQWKSSTHRWIRPYSTDVGKIEEIKPDTYQELKKHIESWTASEKVLIAMHGRYRERIHDSIIGGQAASGDITQGSSNFVLRVGNNLQGVTSFYIDKKVLIIEHLASAPWNFLDSHDSRKCSGVGVTLIKQIFEMAIQKKLKQIVLYPLSKAVPFYKKVGFSFDEGGVFMEINSKGILEFLRRLKDAKS